MQPAHLFCHADCLSYLKAVNLITFSRAQADLRVKLIDYTPLELFFGPQGE
jgi:hypothetical protein